MPSDPETGGRWIEFIGANEFQPTIQHKSKGGYHRLFVANDDATPAALAGLRVVSNLMALLPAHLRFKLAFPLHDCNGGPAIACGFAAVHRSCISPAGFSGSRSRL